MISVFCEIIELCERLKTRVFSIQGGEGIYPVCSERVERGAPIRSLKIACPLCSLHEQWSRQIVSMCVEMPLAFRTNVPGGAIAGPHERYAPAP